MAPKARGPRTKVHADFRPDIEGLRGVAVIGVVIFHALPGVLPGGYVGVDVFFVISGFLITRMLLREIEASGTIKLAGFWARRVRRILPAASLVLVAIAIAAAILLPPVEMREAGEGIAAAGAFVENWRLVANAVDYLRQDASPSVVLHYWSLGVEEQFYLLWPLVLLAAAFAARSLGGGCVRPRVLWATMVGLWLLSFAASLYYTAALPPFAFFGTVTRIWQLLSGALIALAGTGLLVMPERLRSVVLTLALTGLLASMVLITSETPYPGLAALAPTLAATCLIAFGGAGAAPSVAERVLALSPLTGVGRVSYSWYLWHWPFLIFGAGLGVAGVWQNGLLALAALGAGVLTYWFVEAPVRFSPALMRSPRRSLLLGCALVGVGVGAGLALVAYSARTPILLSDGTRLTAKQIAKDRPVIYRDGCFLSQSETEYGPCVYGDPAGKKTVVLFGDSHAAQFFPAIDRAAKEAGWRLLVRAKSACPPGFLIWNRGLGRPYHECTAWQDKVLLELAALEPDMVVFGTEFELLPPRLGRQAGRGRADTGPGGGGRTADNRESAGYGCPRRRLARHALLAGTARRLPSGASKAGAEMRLAARSRAAASTLPVRRSRRG